MGSRAFFSDEEYQALWTRRLAVLSFRKPRWILETILSPLILLLPLLLWLEFSRPALARAAVSYSALFLTSIALYVVQLRISRAKRKTQRSRRLSAILYGMYDGMMVAFFSCVGLMIGAQVIKDSGISESAIYLVQTVAIILYLGIMLVLSIRLRSIISHRLRFPRKPLGSEAAWAIGIPSFLIGASIVLAPILVRSGQMNLASMIAAILGFLVSFIALPVYVAGLGEVIVLLTGGITRQLQPSKRSNPVSPQDPRSNST